MLCPLCDRDCPDGIMERHHLQTRRKDKANVERICQDCHKAIHGLWSNTELRDSSKGLDTLEGILGTEGFRKARVFIQKQAPGTYVRMREARTRRRRR